MKPFVVRLGTKLALQETLVGGKAASLTRLIRAGMRVPPGFVVTSLAFSEFLADLSIGVLAQKRTWSETDLAQIRELLLACRIPEHLARPISVAYEQLGGLVAVRSSMVGEDAEASSFAGQLETLLNVEGRDNVLRATKRCWASMFSSRLFAYLCARESQTPDEILPHLAIAVVVQRMVQATAAGVAFGADPLTGQSCTVVEAVRGLGDALVSGRAKPDRYVVDARGVIAESVPVDAMAPVLAESQIVSLSRLVRDIQCSAEVPQDVEWAWDGERFSLLQSRPITSLVGRSVYSNAMVSDMIPGLIKPLVWSISSIAFLDNVMGRVFSELAGSQGFDYRALAKRIHSRVYVDITTLGRRLAEMGLPPNFFQMMRLDEQSARRQRLPMNLRTLRTMFRTACLVWREARSAGQIAEFVARHNRELEPFRRADWSQHTPAALTAQISRLIDLYCGTMWINFVAQMNMLMRSRMLASLVEKRVSGVLPSDLVRGLIGLKSLGSHGELQELAVGAQRLGGEMQAVLMRGNDAEIRALLSSSQKGSELVQAVDDFLKQYGSLSANGTDMSQTPWIENPGVIWRAIGQLASAPQPHPQHNSEQIRTVAKQRIYERLSWVRRLHFERLLQSTMRYMALREQSSVLISDDSFQMRRAFRALAQQWVEQGRLEQLDDIFYLTLDEVRQLAEGTTDIHDVRTLVATRRAEMEHDVDLELPDVFLGDDVPVRAATAAGAQEFLVGIRGSSGIAEGLARIVLDPSAAPSELTRKDILVVPFTDVSWTLLFTGVGGIVAETGGQLCHSAIIAREYGLPAVVNVKGATRRIREGQHLVVDGTLGRVYLS